MLISLRIPDELLAEIDAEAMADDRSRNSVLIRRLRGDLHGLVRDDARGKNQSNGDGATLPVLRKAASSKIDLHSVQPVREKLDERLRSSEAPPHEGHRTSPYGGNRWCSTCSIEY